MLKGTPIWVLGAAGVACLAIGVGVFTNHRDEMLPQVSEHIVAADVNPTREGWQEPRVVHAGAGGNEDRVAQNEDAETSGTEIEALAPAESQAMASSVGTDAGTEVEGTADVGVEPLAAARAAFAQRDFARVIALLQGADDARFDAHYLYGLVLRYEGRFDESAAAMDAALEVQPQSVRALTNSARALLETRDLAQAEERVRRAIELAPEDTGAWNVLGRLHLSQGALPEAEDAFARVLEIEPAHAWALNNLGFVRLQGGAWDEAAEVLERAVAARADVATFHNNLGIAYERLGRLSDAQRAYAEALTLQPGHGKAELSLARVTERITAGATDLAVREDAATLATNAGTAKVDEDESSVQP